MKRIILYTGKGGVGKTTIAAATAILSANRGNRTLVISTDPAHSLRDAFEEEIGPEPKKLAENLHAQEIDVYYSVDKYWGQLTDYIQSLFSWMNVDDVMAEEFSVFPGMEEVSSFLWIYNHFKENNYDVIIVDSAPTGETLRLLSLPDVAKWWLVKIFPIEKKVLKVVRPAVRVVTNMPLPNDNTYDAIENLFEKLDSIHKIFSDPKVTTIRLVLNLEKMVIKETLRAYTYLSLYGYPVDSMLINRRLPANLDHPYFKEAKDIQNEYRKEVENLFSPLPIFEASLSPKEILGQKALHQFGKDLYKVSDPTKIYYKGKPYEIVKEDGHYNLLVKLPFIAKDKINLYQVSEDLTIQIENQKKNFFLPKFLAKKNVKKANFEEGFLKITFEN